MNKKQKGVATIEWIILAPLTLFIIFFSMMIVVMVIDFVLATNDSYRITDDITRSKYREEATSSISWSNNQYSPTEISGATTMIPKFDGSKSVTLECTPNSYIENAFYRSLTKFKEDGSFDIPYATVNKITCKVIRNNSEATDFDEDTVYTESGAMVFVDIYWNFFGMFDFHSKGFSFIL